MWEVMVEASKRVALDSQQSNVFPRPTVTRNWTLPIAQMSLEQIVPQRLPANNLTSALSDLCEKTAENFPELIKDMNWPVSLSREPTELS